MKELSIEEKAKAYDDLLVKLQKAKEDNNVCDERYCCVIDDIVPELKESEDEKVRKELIAEVKEQIDCIPAPDCRCKEDEKALKQFNKWLDWLEKQNQNLERVKLEKGKWYLCIEDYHPRADCTDFYQGEKYRCEKDGVMGCWVIKNPEKYFRQCETPTYEGSDAVRIQSIIQVLEYARSLPNYNQFGKDDISKDIAWLKKQGEQSSLNSNKECLKGIKRVQEYQDLSDWEKKFDNIASIYAYNKNQEGYNNSWYVKERAAAMLYHAKKELEKQEGKKSQRIISAEAKEELLPNAEPKYQIGDWVVLSENEVAQVSHIRDGRYWFNDMCHYSWSTKECDEKTHLWTIQDAKAGDVLEFDFGIGIFKGHADKYNAYCYCYYNDEDGLVVSNNELLDKYQATPATKERCSLLFQKVKEAGYVWDAEKKELKKIEQKPSHIDYISGIREELLGIEDNAKNINGLTESQWVAIRAAHRLLGEYIAEVQKPAWSEEDIVAIDCAVEVLSKELPSLSASIERLKSLKERYTWKPSDEQLLELRCVISGCSYDIEPLSELEEQLKKLREE